MDDIFTLSPDEVYHRLGSRPEGLNPGEIKEKSIQKDDKPVKTNWPIDIAGKIIRQFTHFFAIILWTAAALCFFVDYYQPGEGMQALGWTVLLVIFINGFFSFIQEFRAEKAAQALKNMLPQKVRVIREGDITGIFVEQLVVGDVLLLEEGDRVPADVRLVEAYGLQVSNATLTGEADILQRDARCSEATSVFEAENVLLSGTMVMSGRGKGVVFATGSGSQFGRVTMLTTGIKKSMSPLEKEIVRVSRTITYIAAGLGTVFFILGLLMGRSLWFNILFAIGIIVALVPEGLLPTVTLTLAVGSQRMAKRNVLVKRLNSIETLGCTTVICTDKTGTITENNMRLENLWLLNDDPSTRCKAYLAMGFANSLQFDTAIGKAGGDPMEMALINATGEYFHETGMQVKAKRLGEFGFTSDRKRMSVLYMDNLKEELFLAAKGAPEVILPLCNLTDPERMRIEEIITGMAGQAMRVIALAVRMPADTAKEGLSPEAPVELWEKDMTFVALAGLADPVREDVPDAVFICREAGIRVMMITGDAPATASAVAARARIIPEEANPVVLTGKSINELSNEEFKSALRSPHIIFARMQPEHKLKVVTALQEMGEVVAMTGDGVNDAPALRKSDIGIAMGLRGTDVARETADMVLLDDHFATIVNAIEEGRSIFANIRKFMSYFFASNTPELVPFLCYVLLGIPLPLSIIQIMAIDLGTDLLPALALGLEKPRKEMMKRLPRRREERLLSAGILFRAYIFLGSIEAVAGMSGYFFVLSKGDWQWGRSLGINDPLYLQATTACLVAIIISQMANLFACRSHYDSAFSIPLKNNPYIILGLLWEITALIVIVYTRPGQLLFRTLPFDTDAWLFLLVFPPILLMFDEARKKMVRMKNLYN